MDEAESNYIANFAAALRRQKNVIISAFEKFHSICRLQHARRQKLPRFVRNRRVKK